LIHEAVLEGAHEVIVAICSAYESHTPKNPLTAGERYYIIVENLREYSRKNPMNYSVIAVPDVNRYSIWVKHMESLCPPFTHVYTGNHIVANLFSDSGYEVIWKRFPEHLSATEIRDAIHSAENDLAHEQWKKCVPGPTVRILEEINGVERIQRSDS
jgi:nicotinamide-nucleotide adenylyltransferase